MQTYTLFKLSINGVVKYFSTSAAEINAFASIYGMIGQAEEDGQVLFQIPGVVAQHPRGFFKYVNF